MAMFGEIGETLDAGTMKSPENSDDSHFNQIYPNCPVKYRFQKLNFGCRSANDYGCFHPFPFTPWRSMVRLTAQS
jgi:hypothetical protein